MEALKIKGRAQNGMLTVAVPDSFNNIEVEVIVLQEKSNIPLLNEVKRQSELLTRATTSGVKEVASLLNNDIVVEATTTTESNSITEKDLRIKALMSIIGTAKDFDKRFDKNEVYEQ